MPKPTESIDIRIKEWATPTQSRYIDAVNKHGSLRAAARSLGVAYNAVHQGIALAKEVAATKGYSPAHQMVHEVPDPFITKGVSTYFNKKGKPTGQWVKSMLDPKKFAQMQRAALDALAEDLPRVKPMPGPRETEAALCNVYTFTDSHVGMLAWHKEGGADWDLKIAEATLVGCFERMVAASPKAAVALVNQLGDFLHYDGLKPVTPTSGHIVDADGRFSKMVGVSIRILRRIIDFALARHEKVVVVLAEGNHDMSSSVWLRHMFKALYENEPRVEVVDSELPYYAHEHGTTMLGFHHGHLTKKDRLPLFFAARFHEMWGRTTKRYCHTGHMHHTDEKDHDGMTVHQHPTLAAADAHSARSAYVSDRRVTALTYHSRYGEVARNTVTPEMLAA